MTSLGYGAMEFRGGPRGRDIADADEGKRLKSVLGRTIVGTSNPDHLRANSQAAAEGPHPDEVYAKAKRRLAAPGSVPANVE